MGLPRATATEQRVFSEPARDSRAAVDASFMKQLQQKLKTPKRLSKEILTQLGLRGAGRGGGGAQTGGRPGEEIKSVELLQQAQAGALSQVTQPLKHILGKDFRPSFWIGLCVRFGNRRRQLGALIDAGR